MGEGAIPEPERERALRSRLERFELELAADPLLPSAEIRRHLDAIADDMLDLFPEAKTGHPS